jgi:hypothetical protein
LRRRSELEDGMAELSGQSQRWRLSIHFHLACWYWDTISWDFQTWHGDHDLARRWWLIFFKVDRLIMMVFWFVTIV